MTFTGCVWGGGVKSLSIRTFWRQASLLGPFFYLVTYVLQKPENSCKPCRSVVVGVSAGRGVLFLALRDWAPATEGGWSWDIYSTFQMSSCYSKNVCYNFSKQTLLREDCPKMLGGVRSWYSILRLPPSFLFSFLIFIPKLFSFRLCITAWNWVGNNRKFRSRTVPLASPFDL